MHVEVRKLKTESQKRHKNMFLKNLFPLLCGLVFMSKIFKMHHPGACELVFIQRALP